MAKVETAGSNKLAGLRAAVYGLITRGDITFDQGGDALSKVDKAGNAIDAYSSINDQLSALDLIPDLDEKAKAAIKDTLFTQRRQARIRSIRRGVAIGFYTAALALSAFVAVDSNSHVQKQTALKLSHPYYSRAQELKAVNEYLQVASTNLLPPPPSTADPDLKTARRYIDTSVQQLGHDIEIGLRPSRDELELISDTLQNPAYLPSTTRYFSSLIKDSRDAIRNYRQNYLRSLEPFDIDIQKANQNKTLGGIGFLTILAFSARGLFGKGLKRGFRRLLGNPIKT